MNQFTPLLASVVPLILLMAVGFAIRRLGLLSKEAIRDLGSLLFWVCLPCLVVSKMASNTSNPRIPWDAVAVGLAVYIFFFVLIFWLARYWPKDKQGGLVAVATRANGAFIGLPTVAFLIDNGVVQDQSMTILLVLLAVIAPITNALGVMGFLIPLHGFGLSAIRKIAVEILRNPIIIACVLGLILSFLQSPWIQKNPVMLTVKLLGDGAVPLAIILAGASLRFAAIGGEAPAMILSVVTKLLLIPCAVWLLSLQVGLDQELLIPLVIFFACPSAMATVTLAQKMAGDVEFVSNAVMLTTILSPFTILIWLMLCI